MIFVFGSNLAGIHGAGAARTAVERHGAIMGQGIGLQGNSYGIPTKDATIRHTLPLHEIQRHVFDFLTVAKHHYPSLINDKEGKSLYFQVTCIGCGLAGLADREIAPMFQDAPPNCFFDEKWAMFLKKDAQFWGTF